ncbi:hypothetical protein C8Q76DRAFT_707418, partial [Earliella scabrosa]
MPAYPPDTSCRTPLATLRHVARSSRPTPGYARSRRHVLRWATSSRPTSHRPIYVGHKRS